MLSSDGAKIRHYIKVELRRSGKTYGQLAAHLNVSERTVKRQLNSEEIGLERLLQMADFLGHSLESFMSEYSKSKEALKQLTDTQEKQLAKDPSLFYLYILLCTRPNYRTAIADAGLALAAGKKKMTALDRLGLIELTKNFHFKLKVRPPILFRSGGPWSQTIFPKVLERQIWNFRETRVGTRLEKTEINRPYELYLSAESATGLATELTELLEKYAKISSLETRCIQFPELKPFAGYIFLKATDLWKSVCTK